MTTFEVQGSVGISRRGLWFYSILAISVGLLLTTALVPFNRPLLRQFDLNVESNLASLWSGLLLLMASLHAFDGWARYRLQKPPLGWAWLIIAAALAGLSLDEVGSIHERLERMEDGVGQILTVTIVLILAAAVLTALSVLYRSRSYASSAMLIAIAMVLLATVPLQENIQGQLQWPGYLDVLRVVLEETTEIIAILLIFKACLGNTGGFFAREPAEAFPFFEAVADLRWLLMILGLAAAFVFAFLAPHLVAVASFSQSGTPSGWLSAAAFFLAALAFLRPDLALGQLPRWQLWVLCLISLVACASTVISVHGLLSFLLMTGLSTLALVFCLLDPRRERASYLPAMLFLAVVLAVGWLLRGSPVMDVLMGQLVGLGFFWIASAPARQVGISSYTKGRKY